MWSLYSQVMAGIPSAVFCLRWGPLDCMQVKATVVSQDQVNLSLEGAMCSLH